jgi:myo-inositol-1(or 4)-monophosphatase
MSTHTEILERIHSALEAARVVLKGFTPGEIEAEYKSGHDPVTEADRAVDTVLHKHLLRDSEGWLSEESVDDPTRLEKQRVWVVDPLDGTREFVAGIPEFCVSVAMVEDGVPIAGGICNPATDELIIGALDMGVHYNGKPATVTSTDTLAGAVVLASRSETKRGEWKPFESAPFQIRSMGSVAYKLGLVAAGLADITFTLTPKHEWDVAAGVALVNAAGGFTSGLGNTPLGFNQKKPWLPGLIACNSLLRTELLTLLGTREEGSAVETAKVSR